MVQSFFSVQQHGQADSVPLLFQQLSFPLELCGLLPCIKPCSAFTPSSSGAQSLVSAALFCQPVAMWLLWLSDLLALFMQHNEICKHRVKDPFLALAYSLLQFMKGLQISIWGSGVGTQKGKV